MACVAASAATRVLPQPTSPCTRRSIGRASARSASISRSTRCCARVRRNGSARAAWPCSASVCGQRPAGLALDALAQQLEREVMRQQLLEREPPLRRMAPAHEQLHRRVGGRAMHVLQRRRAATADSRRRAASAAASPGRSCVESCSSADQHQLAQTPLRDSLGRRIYRRQMSSAAARAAGASTRRYSGCTNSRPWADRRASPKQRMRAPRDQRPAVAAPKNERISASENPSRRRSGRASAVDRGS